MVTSADQYVSSLTIYVHFAGRGSVSLYSTNEMKKRGKLIQNIGWWLMRAGMEIMFGKRCWRISDRRADDD